MAQRGRKPKPTAVKVLEGNPGKRSLNTGEPKPDKKAPRCPAWLEDEAKEGMEADGKTAGAPRNPYGDRYGSIREDTARHMRDGKRQRSSLHSTGPS